MKIVHPEIAFQITFPKYFIRLYSFMVKNIFFLKKYDTIFDCNNFFVNVENQANMNIEYANNKYYYEEYLSNDIFIIPKPILSSNNILILEYIEGYKLDELNISDFEKQKIVALMSLFCKNNYLYLEYFHADLHDSNWKIIYENNIYKIIIYDFGYFIHNRFREFFKKLTLYIDTNNLELISDLMYDSITNVKISKTDFTDNFKNYLNKQYSMYNSVNLTKYIYKFCYINKYYTEKNLFEVFISLLLLKKHMDKYIFISSNTNHSYSYILKINTFYNSLCKKYNIFNNIQNFIYENYITNKLFTEHIKYNNEYFDNLNHQLSYHECGDNESGDNEILNIDI